MLWLLRTYLLRLTKRMLLERLLKLQLLLLLWRRLAAGWGGSFFRAYLAAWCRVYEGLCLQIVWSRRRLYDNFLESFCEVVGEGVAAGIDIN